MPNDLVLFIFPFLDFTVSIRGEQSQLQPELCYLGLLLGTQTPGNEGFTTVSLLIQDCYTPRELTSESGLSGFSDFRFALFFCDNKKIVLAFNCEAGRQ